jgi:hypothetical protein
MRQVFENILEKRLRLVVLDIPQAFLDRDGAVLDIPQAFLDRDGAVLDIPQAFLDRDGGVLDATNRAHRWKFGPVTDVETGGITCGTDRTDGKTGQRGLRNRQMGGEWSPVGRQRKGRPLLS